MFFDPCLVVVEDGVVVFLEVGLYVSEGCFGFAFADRVDYLHPQRWDGLTAHGSVFLRREILRVIEEHGPENIVPRYAIIFRDNKAVAALVAQMVLVTGERLRSEKKAPRDNRSRQLLHHARSRVARAATANVRERICYVVRRACFKYQSRGVRSRLIAFEKDAALDRDKSGIDRDNTRWRRGR